MRKSILILIFAALGLSFLSAQVAGEDYYIDAEGIYHDLVDITIDPMVLAPVSGIYKDKMDTFFMSYKYRMELTEEDVEEYSEELLNTWLKESK